MYYCTRGGGDVLLHMHIQGILGDNDVWLVDYTVLYDEIVRATLWEEVSVCVCHVTTMSSSVITRIPLVSTGPRVHPMEC